MIKKALCGTLFLSDLENWNKNKCRAEIDQILQTKDGFTHLKKLGEQCLTLDSKNKNCVIFLQVLGEILVENIYLEQSRLECTVLGASRIDNATLKVQYADFTQEFFIYNTEQNMFLPADRTFNKEISFEKPLLESTMPQACQTFLTRFTSWKQVCAWALVNPPLKKDNPLFELKLLARCVDCNGYSLNEKMSEIDLIKFD